MVNSIPNISDFDDSDKKVSQAFGIVKHALEAAHQLHKAQMLTSEIRKAVESTDYDFCFNAAQKFLKKYRRMLNSYTFLTGISFVEITREEAYSMGIGYWRDVLKYSEVLIYIDVAAQSELKFAIEDKLRKIFLS